MRNNGANKKYFLQDLVRIAVAVCATKPTIVDLIVSVFAHRICATQKLRTSMLAPACLMPTASRRVLLTAARPTTGDRRYAGSHRCVQPNPKGLLRLDRQTLTSTDATLTSNPQSWKSRTTQTN